MTDPLASALDAGSAAGATACDASLVLQDRLEVEVRGGEVDKLARARDRVLSLRLFRGDRVATVSSSDLSEAGIRSLADRGRELADAAVADPCNGPPTERTEPVPTLDLHCARTAELSPEEATEMARAADRASCDFDSRIRPIEAAGVRTQSREVRLARSDGFEASYRSSAATLYCSALAETPNEKQRDMVFRTASSLEALPSPEEIGREAAARAVRHLEAVKIATTRVPVIYEPRTAVTLVEHLAVGLVGNAIYEGRSFLRERLNQTIATEGLDLVDDGLRPAALGSRPFDGEGVPSQRTNLIQKGVLQSYLLDTYSARRLGLKSTGNGARPLRGSIEPGPSNLFIPEGDEPPASILERTQRGLLVTELLGFGFDAVTGDYSRGVAGLWIENGEIRHAVQEVAVAGNLLKMLQDIDAIGSDLTFFGRIGAPTLRFRELTVAGV